MSTSDRYPFITGVLQGSCEHIARELRKLLESELNGGRRFDKYAAERVRQKVQELAEYAETARATAEEMADKEQKRAGGL